MYRLIIADDESDVREGILQEIDWEKHGFEVAATAENGKEAYELVEKLVPDIVITDIKMPFMDGLSLSELIRQKYPATRIVILTGFDEFEFAQKAVKLRIDEYVLKPFSSQELINVLIKLKLQMDEEVAQRKNVQKLREHYNQSLPILKANFLTLLITRKIDENEILNKAGTFNIDLNAKGFIVSVVNIDGGAREQKPDGPGLLEDRDLALFAVLNVTGELIEKHRLGIVFIHNGDIVVLSLSEDCESDTAVSNTLTVLEEVRYCVEKYLGLSITVGVGTFCGGVSGISASFKDARLALDYRQVLGNNRVIYINDLESRCAKRPVFDELKEEALASTIKVGTADGVVRLVDTLFNELSEGDVSYKDYQIYLMEITMSILKTAKDAGIEFSRVMDADLNLFTDIYRFDSLQAAKDWILGICARITDIIARDRQGNFQQLVKSAKDFIRNHFHESDMTINKVCKYLHISPGYFSTVFKRETKMTFLNYLVQLRMETARELLRMTELKSFEIAEKVGFSDANYFSNSFKKYTGVSPSEFRNRK